MDIEDQCPRGFVLPLGLGVSPQYGRVFHGLDEGLRRPSASTPTERNGGHIDTVQVWVSASENRCMDLLACSSAVVERCTILWASLARDVPSSG
mmetsp:Transcript_5085/g.10071  ORF Transcript_5085/g.10071 Transcript_5085/m.10071 type:complete len:94 (-) Transcript_5085:102-383(-)